ncbi:MAG: hypothetical protein IT178_16360 [Acidobacteria bacterium]|nr:hypothetical protein [Acidobacteriota bacterium]
MAGFNVFSLADTYGRGMQERDDERTARLQRLYMGNADQRAANADARAASADVRAGEELKMRQAQEQRDASQFSAEQLLTNTRLANVAAKSVAADPATLDRWMPHIRSAGIPLQIEGLSPQAIQAEAARIAKQTDVELDAYLSANPAMREIDARQQATLAEIDARERSAARLAAQENRYTLGAITARGEQDRLTDGSRPAGLSSVDQDRIYRGEDRMKGDFEQVTKNRREEQSAARKVRALALTGGKLNAAQQQALIFMFGKVLDPSSVLREGEYDRIASARGYYDTASNLYEKVMAGAILTPKQVRDIGEIAEFYERAANDSITAVASEYDRIARQRGYDPAAIVTDPSYRSRQDAEGGPSTKNGPSAPRKSASQYIREQQRGR